MCREKSKHISMVMKGSEEEKGGTNKDVLSYPARCFSFLSRMPSLDTSLLNTRIPITMFTCRQEEDTSAKTNASIRTGYAALGFLLRPP